MIISDDGVPPKHSLFLTPNNRVFVAKTLKPVVTLSGHAGASTDVKFGPDSQFLATTSMDRTLRFWGLDSDAMSV